MEMFWYVIVKKEDYDKHDSARDEARKLDELSKKLYESYNRERKDRLKAETTVRMLASELAVRDRRERVAADMSNYVNSALIPLEKMRSYLTTEAVDVFVRILEGISIGITIELSRPNLSATEVAYRSGSLETIKTVIKMIRKSKSEVDAASLKR